MVCAQLSSGICYPIDLPARIFHNSAHFRNGAWLFVCRSHEIVPGTWETLHNRVINHSVWELLDCYSNCAQSCRVGHECERNRIHLQIILKILLIKKNSTIGSYNREKHIINNNLNIKSNRNYQRKLNINNNYKNFTFIFLIGIIRFIIRV